MSDWLYGDDTTGDHTDLWASGVRGTDDRVKRAAAYRVFSLRAVRFYGGVDHQQSYSGDPSAAPPILAPGCHALQADGLTFIEIIEIIVVEARPPS